MRQPLALHPDSRSTAVTRIDVLAHRRGPGHLVVRYTVAGKIGALLMPKVTSSTRANELWKHTCFEAFVRGAGLAAYYEFNFAPSTQWAAYGFSEYRQGMHVAAEVRTPFIEVNESEERYTLQAALELEKLPDLPKDAVWRVGLAAVIEDKYGGTSYWALTHPPGKPDFHQYDCFALEIPAA
jgi:hypothetical protein